MAQQLREPKTLIQYPEPIWRLKTICCSNSRGLFWPQVLHTCGHIHTCRQSTQSHKIKTNIYDRKNRITLFLSETKNKQTKTKKNPHSYKQEKSWQTPPCRAMLCTIDITSTHNCQGFEKTRPFRESHSWKKHKERKQQEVVWLQDGKGREGKRWRMMMEWNTDSMGQF